jgi:hypothetical protein
LLVLGALEVFNDAFAIKLDALDKARSTYNAAIADLRGIYRDLADHAQTYFDERSERWQQGDAGTAYDAWMNGLAEAAERLVDLDEFAIEELAEPELEPDQPMSVIAQSLAGVAGDPAEQMPRPGSV